MARNGTPGLALCLAVLGLSLFPATGAPAQTGPAQPGAAQPGSPASGRADVRMAQPPGPLPTGEIQMTLPEAVFVSLRQNRQIRSAYLNRIVQKFDLRVAEDKFMPQGNLTGSVNVERDTNGPTTSVLAAGPNATLLLPTGAQFAFAWNTTQTRQWLREGTRSAGSDLTLTVTQPLLRGAGIDVNTASVRLARIAEAGNLLQLRDTISNTITQVIQAYHAFVAARQQLDIARVSLQRAGELLEVNRALVEAGRMAANEVVQTEATVATQEVSLLTAENAFDAARLALLDLLALDARTRIVPSDRLTAQFARIDVEKARELALANRSDFRQQQLALRSAEINLAVAKNSRLWDLSMTGGVAVNTQDRQAGRAVDKLDNTRPDLRVGLQLVIPLRDLTREQGEVSASIGLRQAELQLEVIEASLDRVVRDAVRNVDIRWKQLSLAQRARELAARTLELELAKLRSGRSSNFQVLQFQDNLQAAETAELSALVAYVDFLATLDRELGTTLETWQIDLRQGSE